MIRIIGDVHGKIDEYKKITDNCDYSIQLGDVGFKNEWDEIANRISANNHKIVAGNHDNYDVLFNIENNLGDYGLTKFGFDFFFVRGAYTLDHKERIMDISIWPEKEELSYEQLNQVISLYENTLPEIVLTHDAPKIATTIMFKPSCHYPSRTVEAFDQMLEIHKPKLWIFGHWHYTSFTQINETLFVCLGELKYIDYDKTKSANENCELIKNKFGICLNKRSIGKYEIQKNGNRR